MQHSFNAPPFTPSSLLPVITPSNSSFNIPQSDATSSQNPIAGPSSAASNMTPIVPSSTVQSQKRPGAAVTKKRNLPTDGQVELQLRREVSKKKKAARACFHCQKAHLTCDDSRPCQRCIKRGIGDSCTEGHRKKAKYLLDDRELAALKKGKGTGTNGKSPDATNEGSSSFPSGSDVLQDGIVDDSLLTNDPLFNLSFDPNYSFGSEAANLEYSILSAILGNPNHDQPHTSNSLPGQTPYPSSFANAAWPAEPPNSQGAFAPSALMGQPQTSPNVPSDGAFDRPSIFSPLGLQQLQQPTPPSQPEFAALPSPPINAFSPSQISQPQQDRYQGAIQQAQQLQSMRPSIPMPTVSSTAHAASPMTHPSPVSSLSYSDNNNGRPDIHSRTPHEVYDSVTKAYDYTEGYHFLMKFLSNRFEKNDILRVVRALAIFRPSLIALQTPLSEEDEVFVEKCFQRTVKELDKLISYSGTPTVVWRRTGEICLVGPEFCLLSEWSKEELVNGRKYIYELFENQSVVEYWEKFASHAFENTTQSVYSHCVLLKPSGEPIPCTFCFSIRRDIFDLPSVVIGQWLPLF